MLKTLNACEGQTAELLSELILEIKNAATDYESVPNQEKILPTAASRVEFKAFLKPTSRLLVAPESLNILGGWGLNRCQVQKLKISSSVLH